MKSNYNVWSRGEIINKNPLTHEQALRMVRNWNKPFYEGDKARAIRFTKTLQK